MIEPCGTPPPKPTPRAACGLTRQMRPSLAGRSSLVRRPKPAQAEAAAVVLSTRHHLALRRRSIVLVVKAQSPLLGFNNNVKHKGRASCRSEVTYTTSAEC